MCSSFFSAYSTCTNGCLFRILLFGKEPTNFTLVLRTVKLNDLTPSVMGYVETLFGHQDHALGLDGLRGETGVTLGGRDKTCSGWPYSTSSSVSLALSIEGGMTIPDAIKQPTLRSLHIHTIAPKWNYDGCGPNEKDGQLLVEYDVVVEAVTLLSPDFGEGGVWV